MYNLHLQAHTLSATRRLAPACGYTQTCNSKCACHHRWQPVAARPRLHWRRRRHQRRLHRQPLAEARPHHPLAATTLRPPMAVRPAGATTRARAHRLSTARSDRAAPRHRRCGKRDAAARAAAAKAAAAVGTVARASAARASAARASTRGRIGGEGGAAARAGRRRGLRRRRPPRDAAVRAAAARAAVARAAVAKRSGGEGCGGEKW
jgi:hypothetical protein